MYFRETYDVDLSTFNFNSSIEEEKVYNEVIEGIGYDILKGLFDPLEIKHARETILYLISKQGSKATHFQVCLIDNYFFVFLDKYLYIFKKNNYM